MGSQAQNCASLAAITHSTFLVFAVIRSVSLKTTLRRCSPTQELCSTGVTGAVTLRWRRPVFALRLLLGARMRNERSTIIGRPWQGPAHKIGRISLVWTYRFADRNARSSSIRLALHVHTLRSNGRSFSKKFQMHVFVSSCNVKHY